MADELKLLTQLKNKERNSIDKAIDVYTPYLSTVLYNMVGNRLPKEDIEEIVSDVFVTLWKNADYPFIISPFEYLTSKDFPSDLCDVIYSNCKCETFL